MNTQKTFPAITNKYQPLSRRWERANTPTPSAILPQCVHHPPVAPQPQQPVGRRDPVRVRLPGIPEEGVGNPDLSDHVAVEHEQLHGAVEFQPAVIPRLSEEDVDGVFLPRSRLHVGHQTAE